MLMLMLMLLLMLIMMPGQNFGVECLREQQVWMTTIYKLLGHRLLEKVVVVMRA